MSSNLVGPYQVAIDITNECNYRCLHCYNSSGNNCVVNNELSDDDWMYVAEVIAEVKPQSVCFCGGEPLLKYDLICKMAQIFTEAGIPSIGMVTNGSLLTEDKLVQFLKYNIASIQISLDGENAETCYKLRQNKSAYDYAVNAIQLIRKFSKNRIHCDVSFCPTSFNINEFQDVYEFCNKYKVRELRAQPLMISGRAINNEAIIKPSREQYNSLEKSIHQLKKKIHNEPGYITDIEWADPIDHIMRSYEGFSPKLVYITIKANGYISFSPYIPLVIGNLQKYSLKEYWAAGIEDVWSYSLIKEYAKNIFSISEMKHSDENFPLCWIEDDVYIDFIQDKYLYGNYINNGEHEGV